MQVLTCAFQMEVSIRLFLVSDELATILVRRQVEDVSSTRSGCTLGGRRCLSGSGIVFPQLERITLSPRFIASFDFRPLRLLIELFDCPLWGFTGSNTKIRIKLMDWTAIRTDFVSDLKEGPQKRIMELLMIILNSQSE
jgi:hypothetical protein